jgi:hypothetical protein
MAESPFTKEIDSDPSSSTYLFKLAAKQYIVDSEREIKLRKEKYENAEVMEKNVVAVSI